MTRGGPSFSPACRRNKPISRSFSIVNVRRVRAGGQTSEYPPKNDMRVFSRTVNGKLLRGRRARKREFNFLGVHEQNDIPEDVHFQPAIIYGVHAGYSRFK